ncbi:TBC1 domain family member 31 [Aix galericulata]|nr:TBC1 domain family member 31 [Aix galericulata]
MGLLPGSYTAMATVFCKGPAVLNPPPKTIGFPRIIQEIQEQQTSQIFLCCFLEKPSSSGLFCTVIVNITHTAPGSPSKTIRFLNVAFDSSGDSLLAGDHQGNIYVFDLKGNRFNLVQRTMQACTALAFNLRRKTEFLVALADYSIKCFDTETKELVSWMRGHDSSVSSISVNGSGRYAITTSTDTAQLWDLDTFQRKRKLNVRHSVGIQKVFFLPLSNTILSCFKDNSVFAWEFDTLHCKYQLPTPVEGSTLLYKVFAVTRDGRIFVAGGKSNHLHLWCLESKQLIKIIQMPTKVRAVRHLEFLPDSFDGGSNQVLGVLSQDNMMRFINIETCKLLFAIGSHEEGISTAAISPNGRYIASVMENGSVNLYSVQALTQEANKPPPPQFKVVEDWPRCKSEANKLTMKVSSGRSERPWKSKGNKIQTRLLKVQANTSLENKENELPGGLNKKRLQALLKGYGEYPAKYRMFVWRSLLQLPENHLAFSSLIDKGTHSAFVNIQNEYPIKSRKLLRVLQRTLSALAHWSAIFGETPYIPLLAFPFVKLFQNNQLICFEVVATVVVNFCQHWFEYFPNPPVNVLSMMENILAHHDKELLQHFIKYNVTSQVYAWPLLETLFSEVLTREEWLKVFDNIFSNHPSYFLMIVVAYIVCSRAPLLHCNQRQDFEASMREQETAATVQDVEVRQMELESQRQLFEQHLIKDQESSAQEMKEEIDASRRKADLEDHVVQRLMETDREEKQKAQMVAEENLAKAEQKCVEIDWRLQALHKLRHDDKDREKHYEEIAKLLHDNRVKEAELLKALREAEEKKWEEVVRKKAQLEEEQKAAAAAHEHRKQFLEDEMNDALNLAEKLQREDAYFERLRDLKAGHTGREVEFQQMPKSGNVCLNDLSASESSSYMSSVRRRELACQERELMAEVRQLRQKLTAQARVRHPPTHLSSTKWTT